MQKHKSGDPDTVGNHNICLHEKNDGINFMHVIKLDDSSEGIQQFPLLTASAAIFSVSMIFLTNWSRQLHFCYSFTQDFVLRFKSWVENDFDFVMIHSMSTEGNLNPIPWFFDLSMRKIKTCTTGAGWRNLASSSSSTNTL